MRGGRFVLRRLAVLLMGCFLAATACSGDDDDSGADSATSDPTTTTEAVTTTTEAPITTAAPRSPEEQAFLDALGPVASDYDDEDDALGEARLVCETLRAGGASLDLDASFVNLELTDASGTVVVTMAPEFHLAATEAFCPEFAPQTLPSGGP